MKSAKAVLKGAALCGLWAEAAATSSLQWFAEGVSDPILDGIRNNGAFNQSSGPEPFLRAFIDGEIVPYYNSCYVLTPQGQPDCHQIQGECAPSEVACGYVYMITALVLSAVIATGIFAILGICSCGCCLCPANTAPRRTRPWGSVGVGDSRSKIRVFTLYALGLTAALVTVFSVIGFLSMLELSEDVLSLLDGVKEGSLVAAVLKKRALSVIALADEKAEAFSNIKGDKLRGLPQMVDSVKQIQVSLAYMKAQTFRTEAFVEGCPAGVASCEHLSNEDPLDTKNWNRCIFEPVDGPGKHDEGVAATLSNGNPNPACRDKKTGSPGVCPCCAKCDRLTRSIDLVSSQIPTSKDLGVLNATFPIEEVPAAAKDAFSKYQDPLKTATESFESLTKWVTKAQDTMVSKHWVFALVAVGFWIPSWIAVGIVVFGILLLANHGNNRTLWWTAFGLGLASCLLLLAPIFGFVSLVVIPFSDLCTVIPKNNQSSAAFLALLEGDLDPDPHFDLASKSSLGELSGLLSGKVWSNRGDQPGTSLRAVRDTLQLGLGDSPTDSGFASKLLNGCILNKHGFIWDIMDIERSQLDSTLKIQSASATVPPTAVARALDWRRYRDMSGIQGQINSLDTEDASFGVSDCGAADFKGCQADMEAYDKDLSGDFEKLKVNVGKFGLAAHKLVALSEQEQNNVTALLSGADVAAQSIESAIWNAGSCDFLNEKYEGFRAPLCDEMAFSIRAMWGAILLAALSWVPLLFLLLVIAIRGWKCWTSKYDFQLILDMDEGKSSEPLPPEAHKTRQAETKLGCISQKRKTSARMRNRGHLASTFNSRSSVISTDSGVQSQETAVVSHRMSGHGQSTGKALYEYCLQLRGQSNSNLLLVVKQIQE